LRHIHALSLLSAGRAYIGARALKKHMSTCHFISVMLTEFVVLLAIISITGVLASVGVVASEFRDCPGSHYLHYFDDDDA
jgi:hypothetical protein